MTTIRYFIPGDGDSENHPNVFLASKPKHPGHPPLLGEIKKALPLPGKYHFRFKSSLIPGGEQYGGKGADFSVWMDCVEDSQPVPTWKGTIVAKLTRVSGVNMVEETAEYPVYQNGHANEIIRDPTPPPPQTQTYQQVSAPPPPSVNPVSPQISPEPSTENLLGVFDDPSPASSAIPSSSTHSSVAPSSSSGNLFDVDEPPAVGSVGSLLDMDVPAAHGNRPSSAADDLLGLSSHGLSTSQPPPPQPQPVAAPVMPANQYQQQQYQRQQQMLRQQQMQQQMQQQQVKQQQMQQQQMKQQQQRNKPNTVFDSFSKGNDSFGGLNWS